MLGGDIMLYDLTENEKIIMNHFWERNDWISGAEMWEHFHNVGKDYDRSTVNSYLARMTAKGLLKKEKTKYVNVLTKEEFEIAKTECVLNTMYDGSLSNFLCALHGSNILNDVSNAKLKDYLNELCK